MSAAGGAALVAARGLVVGHHRALLPPVSLRLLAGERWAVLGGNGAGKSTLVSTLLGLVPARAGSVERRGQASYVPQRQQVAAELPCRVLDWVAQGALVGWRFLLPGGAGRRRQAAQALVRTGMDGFQAASLHELSEGQRQRVHVARALACQPAWLVLDESTSAMDAAGEAALMAEVGALCRADGLAVLWVGHQVAAMVAMASHLVVLDGARQLALAGPREEVLAAPAAAGVVAELGGSR